VYQKKEFKFSTNPNTKRQDKTPVFAPSVQEAPLVTNTEPKADVKVKERMIEKLRKVRVEGTFENT
jgi:hypothetical protein